MAVSQTHYRWGSDSGTESTYPFLAAEDTGITSGTGVTLLLRICLQAAAAEGNLAPQFQCRKNAGTYQDITTSSTICRAVTTAVFANAANTTQRLSGTGTFESTSQGCTHDGLAGGAQMDIVLNGNAETVCALQLVATDVAADDVIDFRIVRSGAAIEGYTVTPTLTVTVAAVLVGAGALPAIRWSPRWSLAASLRAVYGNLALPGPAVLVTWPNSAPLLDESGAELLDEYGHEALYDETALLEVVETVNTWTIYRSRLRAWS